MKQGILTDILSSHRAEVIALFLTDYDEQSHMAMERDEWWEKGLKQGEIIKLIKQIRKKLRKPVTSAEIADMLEEDIGLVEKICKLIWDNPNMTDEEISRMLP